MILSLAAAIREDRLEDFIRQAEVAGIGPVKEAAFLSATSKVIKHEPRSDRTSRSGSRDGSTEK
ncbi:MAG: hypothetical protein M9924_08015 [Rhizobiaceae bacterium]|nr:hypothetical protein [Rhizobiaceae bacterium]